MSRRNFLKITAVAAAALAVPEIAHQALRVRQIQLTETRSLMGTIVHLTVITPDETTGRKALDATFGEMERLIAIFDHRRDSSPLAMLNRSGQLTTACPELISVMSRALHYGALTNGAFDVTVKPIVDRFQLGKFDVDGIRELVDYRQITVTGDRITFSKPGMAVTLDGIAKGYVVDKGTDCLQQYGFDNVIVESGGDLYASGHTWHNNAWQIGVAHPRPNHLNGYAAHFSLSDRAVATSGDYLNNFTQDFSRHHIIDPRTGNSPTELASVSVVAPDATSADALSTALMVMPLEEGIALVNGLPEVEALFVSKDLTIRRTRGFPVL
jgi:thiamine biosynthesis lipoprotein